MATQALTVVRKQTAPEIKLARAQLRHEKQKADRETVFAVADRMIAVAAPFLPIAGYIGGIIACEYLHDQGTIKDTDLRDGMEIMIDLAFVAHAFGVAKAVGDTTGLAGKLIVP